MPRNSLLLSAPIPNAEEIRIALNGNKIQAIKDYLARTAVGSRRIGLKEAKETVVATMELCREVGRYVPVPAASSA